MAWYCCRAFLNSKNLKGQSSEVDGNTTVNKYGWQEDNGGMWGQVAPKFELEIDERHSFLLGFDTQVLCHARACGKIVVALQYDLAASEAYSAIPSPRCLQVNKQAGSLPLHRAQLMLLLQLCIEGVINTGSVVDSLGTFQESKASDNAGPADRLEFLETEYERIQENGGVPDAYAAKLKVRGSQAARIAAAKRRQTCAYAIAQRAIDDFNAMCSECWISSS